ncbi:MAG: DUF192 domain-containing protein, partial [Actinobacteria bacterium]|nr:DUF192 domain-containing protein [Actinomycetota bacterium]
DIADNFRGRFLGLMGMKDLRLSEGLALIPCNSVHSFFMKFPIDVLFLDAQGRVLRCTEAMRPWRVGVVVPGARVVIEAKSGAFGATVQVDDIVEIRVQP